MTLVLRKLLASSTFAIAGALGSIADRLKARLKKQEPKTPLDEELNEDYEAMDETAEEWSDDEEDPLSEADRAAIEEEIADLEKFAALAVSIKHNAKGTALLQALRVAFAKAREIGAAEKAIIFTESRKTQNYILRVLSDSEFGEGVLLCNGSNTDEHSKAIYAAWVEKHAGTDRITGSKSADMRSALVEYFRNEGRIMIATEAGAEGINLQFCSLIVNYDLPWNPQRIEQRIGRCHRYGQKHDVVVVNFLNRKNAADQRVYELLSEKFHLFEGVFGASDEVLGAIESGVDFEKRIAGIYQRCRKTEDIKTAFEELQSQLDSQINEAMKQTRRKLLENFDDEVREKLRVRADASAQSLDRIEQNLMRLTAHELRGHADFIGDDSFRLKSCPFRGDIPLGLYELPRRTGEAHVYRLSHPLAEAITQASISRDLKSAEIRFDYGSYIGKLVALEQYRGASGWLTLTRFTVDAFDQIEDHLLFSASTDQGHIFESSVAALLFKLPGHVASDCHGHPPDILAKSTTQKEEEILQRISERNNKFFDDEVTKLDAWADDLKLSLEQEIKEMDRKIKELRTLAKKMVTLQEKLEAQRKIRSMEKQRIEKRRALFTAQDEIDEKRDELISNVEKKLRQKTAENQIFTIRWRLD